MKSAIASIFIGSWFFIFGAAFIQGEEALVARRQGDILAIITNKLDLSPAKEEFFRNYFEKKIR
jgi:hypothetical protein